MRSKRTRQPGAQSTQTITAGAATAGAVPEARNQFLNYFVDKSSPLAIFVVVRLAP